MDPRDRTRCRVSVVFVSCILFQVLPPPPTCVDKPRQPTAWRFLGTARPAGGMEEMTRFQKGGSEMRPAGGTRTGAGEKSQRQNEEDSRPFVGARRVDLVPRVGSRQSGRFVPARPAKSPSPQTSPDSWELQARGSAFERAGLRRQSREPRAWRLNPELRPPDIRNDKMGEARDTPQACWLVYALISCVLSRWRCD